MGTLIDLNVRCADDIHWQGCQKITHWSGELMILISMTAGLMALVPGPPAIWWGMTIPEIKWSLVERMCRVANHSCYTDDLSSWGRA